MPEYEIEKEQAGKLPKVDVDVEGGALPEFDVDVPEVEVEKDTVEVPVPDVDVVLPGEPGYDEEPGEDRPGS